MTNKEWLDYLAHNAPDELAAWFDAEHVENTIQEQVNKLTIERDNLADDLLIANKQREWYREKFGKCNVPRAFRAHRGHALRHMQEAHMACERGRLLLLHSARHGAHHGQDA